MQKPNSLSHHIQTNEELAIVTAVETSVLVGQLKDLTPLLQIVGKWRLYVGLPKDDVSHELTIATDFIREQFGFLTLQEIELAYKLSVVRKLENCDFFGYFAPIYIGKVLSAYLYYRKMTLAESIRRKEEHEYAEMQKKNTPTPKEEMELTKDIFKSFYEQYKKEGVISDVFNLCYKHLRQHSSFSPDKKMVDDAMEYAKFRVSQMDKELFRDIIKSPDNEIKRWARNYCVQKYFDNIDINLLLDSIKEEQFIKNN